MGSEMILKCRCKTYTTDGDWNNDRKRTTFFCKRCDEKLNTKVKMLNEKLEELTKEMKERPSNLTVDKIFDIEEQILKRDERMSYNEYCQENIHCPVCKNNIKYNNLKKHLISLGHIKKLPEKNNELNKNANLKNEMNQLRIKSMNTKISFEERKIMNKRIRDIFQQLKNLKII